MDSKLLIEEINNNISEANENIERIESTGDESSVYSLGWSTGYKAAMLEILRKLKKE
jgi:hypothetical protein